MQEQQHTFCDDISDGASPHAIPAVIDNHEGLQRSGIAAPLVLGDDFIFDDDPRHLRVTPAARDFLNEAYPPSKPADIWAGCSQTDLPPASVKCRSTSVILCRRPQRS